MRLGIYIGSFNPPHKGHISIVNYLIDNGYIDKVLIIPTMNYWNKQNLVDIKDRINMLKFYENKDVKIDTKHNNYIYTYELMRVISNEYKYDELYLIIGADNIINFDKWKRYDELLKYNIIIMNRDNIDIYKYIKKYNTNNFIIISNFNNINISSTDIRNAIRKNDIEFLNKNIDYKVIKYIKKRKLYK